MHGSRSEAPFARSSFVSRWLPAVSMVLVASAAFADVRLPHVFGDHMVLQADMPVRIWGWADPGEKVTVTVAGRTAATAATDSGRWEMELPALKAGGPVEITVAGKNTVRIRDVLIGEVWLASGQSNMEMPVAGVLNTAEEIQAANFPEIRLFHVPRRASPTPQDDVDAAWEVCSPQTVPRFSAAAYFFGREIHRRLKVPVGLIESAWGGTRIEPWTPPCGFEGIPRIAGIRKRIRLGTPGTPERRAAMSAYLKELTRWFEEARTALEENRPVTAPPEFPKLLLPLASRTDPTSLYNGMIHPLIPFTIRGALWYQGEANHREGVLYFYKMKALIQGWRKLWNEGPFPFYYVQIAPYMYGKEDPDVLPKFWLAQARAMTIPNTGMALTLDIGDVGNIHPKNKQEVGRRLALWALAKTYGRKDIEYSGPVFRGLKIEGKRVRVFFDHAEGGLKTRDGKAPDWFEIAGADGVFRPAKAVIEGEAVVVWSEDVPEPAAVRFAWSKKAMPNLCNQAGLPAFTFRAGKLPEPENLAVRYVPVAKEYEPVYTLDIPVQAKLHEQPVPYLLDRGSEVTEPFDRIAYFLELKKKDGPVQWIFVSMPAFTRDVRKIGVPTFASGAVFQRLLDDLAVWSNVPGVPTGEGIRGNIEFWPSSYSATNDLHIPNASSKLFDFGDSRGRRQKGYASMQVHSWDHKTTLFAWNHWGSGAKGDLGIGNRPEGNPDWTFAANADEYEIRRLQVLVHIGQ